MGTKNNPGSYDCYQKAEPDEPLFVLLARDRHAPALVWLWSVLRELEKEESAVVDEARQCVADMMNWQMARGREYVGLGLAVMMGLLELNRMARVFVKQTDQTEENEGLEFLRYVVSGLTLPKEPPA